MLKFKNCKKYISLNKDCKYNFNNIISKPKINKYCNYQLLFMLIIDAFVMIIIIFHFPTKIN